MPDDEISVEEAARLLDVPAAVVLLRVRNGDLWHKERADGVVLLRPEILRIATAEAPQRKALREFGEQTDELAAQHPDSKARLYSTAWGPFADDLNSPFMNMGNEAVWDEIVGKQLDDWRRARAKRIPDTPADDDKDPLS